MKPADFQTTKENAPLQRGVFSATGKKRNNNDSARLEESKNSPALKPPSTTKKSAHRLVWIGGRHDL